MNIQFDKTSNVSAELTITFEKADYQERVDKALKNYRKKAALPGFRPGQVPMSLMKKRFGGEITAEEVQKLLSEKLYGYLRENKVNMLGEPLASEKQSAIDFEAEQLDFIFDIALAPEFDAKLTAKDKIPYYTIEITDEMIDGQAKAYAQRGGHYDKVESYQSGDMTKGHIAELDDPRPVLIGARKEGEQIAHIHDAESGQLFAARLTDAAQLGHGRIQLYGVHQSASFRNATSILTEIRDL